MYKITNKKLLTDNIYLMDIEAPRVAKSAQPGQFIIIKNNEKGERIPLTIADYNREEGIVTIVFQTVGYTTKELAKYEVGDYVKDFVGPLGQPSELIHEDLNYLKDKNLIFIAGGVGAAPVYPQVKYLKEKGFNIDVIYGARNKDLLIIKEKIEKVADKVYYVTDDGTYGEKGFVTDVLKKHINEYDICVAIGPVIMMKNISELTRKYNLKTIVSMNPIMVDGTGMCGACRCEVEGKPKFACIDGPEFDGHKIDFDIALKRLNIYKEEEEKLKNRGEEKSD